MRKITSLLLILISSMIMTAQGQTWKSVSTGTSAPVQSLKADPARNVMYVGGLFVTAGGALTTGIARWNGTSFSPLGSGLLNGLGITSMTMQDGSLIAAGSFTSIGGVLANNIARWNGASWLPLGQGLNYTGATTVSTLCVYNGELYAGGTFLSSGLTTVNYIARWTGSQWRSVGTGMNGPVKSLCVYNGELYVGGQFTRAGGVAVNNLAKWNGTSWSTVGSVTNYTGATTVSTMCVYNGELYAGGTFTNVGSLPVNNIAKWDGATWAPVGVGVTNYTGATTVSTLCVFDGSLVAGGTFSTAGGLPTSNIARWDGVQWNTLGTGMDNKVAALETLGSTLYAGGNFVTVGGVLAPYIAQWGIPFAKPETTLTSIRTVKENDGFVIYPNPAENILYLKAVKNLNEPATVTIVDMLGKQVLVSNEFSDEIQVERGNLPSGIYIYKVTSQNGVTLQQGLVSFK